MNPEKLLNAGFEAYKHPEPDCVLYSKTILISRQKAYFIHATQWTREGRVSVEFETHFYLPEGSKSGIGNSGFRVTFVPVGGAEIEGVEAFFKQVYDLHGCIPDIHNND